MSAEAILQLVVFFFYCPWERGPSPCRQLTRLVCVCGGCVWGGSYRFLDKKCGLRDAYADICANPRQFKVKSHMIKPEEYRNDHDHSENIYVTFCGPTVPDMKAAFQLLGMKSFFPFICPICQATPRACSAHHPGKCADIDHSGARPYHAGLVNVVAAVEMQQQVKLEVGLYHARDLTDFIRRLLAAGSEAPGDTLREFGKKLADTCTSVNENIVDGKSVLHALKESCFNLAHGLNPKEISGPSAEPDYALKHNFTPDQLRHLGWLASDKPQGEENKNAGKVMKATERNELVRVVKKALKKSDDGDKKKELVDYFFEASKLKSAPSFSGLISPLEVALTNALEARYFGNSVRAHPDGIMGAAKAAAEAYRDLVDELILVVGDDYQSTFDDYDALVPELKAALVAIDESGQLLEEAIRPASGDNEVAADGGDNSQPPVDPDERVYTAAVKALKKIYSVMPKSSDTQNPTRSNGNKRGAGLAAKFNGPDGLNGVLHPSLLEVGGSYVPGILHQGKLRTGGFFVCLNLEIARSYDRLRKASTDPSFSEHHPLLAGRELRYTTSATKGKSALLEPSGGGAASAYIPL